MFIIVVYFPEYQLDSLICQLRIYIQDVTATQACLKATSKKEFIWLLIHKGVNNEVIACMMHTYNPLFLQVHSIKAADR